MNVKTLKRLLRDICDAGYAEWIPWFCRPDGEFYSINAIWVDGEGDIYLHSTDVEDDLYEYTAWNILKRLNKHYPKTYVYVKITDEDGDSYCWDIEDNWYIDTDYDDDYDEEFERLYIDCCEMD